MPNIRAMGRAKSTVPMFPMFCKIRIGLAEIISFMEAPLEMPSFAMANTTPMDSILEAAGT